MTTKAVKILDTGETACIIDDFDVTVCEGVQQGVFSPATLLDGTGTELSVLGTKVGAGG
jgi:hypothetical protein